MVNIVENIDLMVMLYDRGFCLSSEVSEVFVI